MVNQWNILDLFTFSLDMIPYNEISRTQSV